MRKFFHQIHLWLSIPFGLIITIICLTGAALVFEKEIAEHNRHSLYYVDKPAERPLPAGQLMNRITQQLPDSISVTGVTIFSDPARAYQISLSQPRRAALYVDQYTGDIKGRYERNAFFTCMFKMHRWLLDSTVSVGKRVVGVSTLVFVVVLLSGIVIWLPRTRKGLRNRLKITVNKGASRFWYDLHIAGGMYATLLLLAMALTGLTWSFPWYRTVFYNVFGVEVQQQQPHGQKSHDTSRPSAATTGNAGERGQRKGQRSGMRPERQRDERTKDIFAHWQEVYEQLAAGNPTYKQISISDGTANVSFERLGNQRASDRYTFDPVSGQVTATTLYDEQDKSGKIRGWIYSIHVGSWGGMLTRILTFLAAVLGGLLPLTGYYFYLKKRMRKRRAKLQNR